VTGPALLASALLVALGVAATLLRRRGRAPGAPPPLTVEARIPLSRDAGVAVLRAGGDALLVGWGRGGVRLVARLRDGGLR
jgi:hypothetical protein